MASSSENYVILSEVLRKMNFDVNYEPTDLEHNVLISLLEREEKDLLKKSKTKRMKPLNTEWQ